jgi:hypothetical protein
MEFSMYSAGILIVMLFFASTCLAQVNPAYVTLSKEFHKNAVKFEELDPDHRLNLESLLKKLNSTEKKVIIDLRGAAAFQKKHLKDALNIPMEDLTETKLKEIAPDKKTPIIIYCDNSFLPTRMISLTNYGYPTLKQFGYENVFEIEPLWMKSMEAPKELEPFWVTSK